MPRIVKTALLGVLAKLSIWTLGAVPCSACSVVTL
jgi:hypothetical protein